MAVRTSKKGGPGGVQRLRWRPISSLEYAARYATGELATITAHATPAPVSPDGPSAGVLPSASLCRRHFHGLCCDERRSRTTQRGANALSFIARRGRHPRAYRSERRPTLYQSRKACTSRRLRTRAVQTILKWSTSGTSWCCRWELSG